MPNKIDQVNLNIFYGYRCNYSCVGCFAGSDHVQDKNHDPSMDEIYESIPILSTLFNVTNEVTLIGGEPFMYWRERIVPLSREIRKHFPGVKITTITNGQLLGNHVDEVIDWFDEMEIASITVTRHIDSIADSVPGKKWHAGADKFFSHPRLVKIHSEHYHIKDNINANIHLNRPDQWMPSFKYTDDGKIKPFATNDPAGSMKHGCPGRVCSCTFGTKLYKCPKIAALPLHLTTLNQSDDPDWEKYLNYPALDLKNITIDDLEFLKSTYGKPTEHCDMCNNQPVNNIPWYKRDQKMLFRAKDIP